MKKIFSKFSKKKVPLSSKKNLRTGLILLTQTKEHPKKPLSFVFQNFRSKFTRSKKYFSTSKFSKIFKNFDPIFFFYQTIERAFLRIKFEFERDPTTFRAKFYFFSEKKFQCQELKKKSSTFVEKKSRN